MDKLIGKLLDINAVARNQTTLKAALAALADTFGFSGYGYLNLRPGDLHAVSNLSDAWQERYFKDTLRLLDPRVRRAQREKRAFVWSTDGPTGKWSKEDKKFYTLAAEFGIRSGLVMPVQVSNGAIAMLNFASAEPVPIREWKIDAVAAASAVAQLHMLIGHLRTKPSIEEHIYLGPKEATFVRWLELGKTVEDVADLEEVKYNTVRIALVDARRRYDLCNNTQLVALAIRRGLI
ncbi:transcriptional regulator TraR [Neorhizobium sp. JUb45]|uniref:autoinducer-binding transcriptional regulator TraR n=1 Tax=unclassified Neorhizobium TaxID=2629175 RepID=UPI001046EBFC|nr:transcriptional regulator TraR [Neorhizobium sp. JUb45]TCQ98030.1 LuxR family transcriptional activator of conjugal transfer of Ti plasmids [Neorhizobium sp. JUb45]